MHHSEDMIGETVPANRIGCPGVILGKSGEFMREFADGVHPVPFSESSFTVEKYPLRTEVGVQYFVILRIHVGKAGEYLDIPMVTTKDRYSGSERLGIMFLNEHFLDGSQADIELTEHYIGKELKRFQAEYDQPDFGAVRGTLTDARIELKYCRFDSEMSEYVCRFVAFPNVGGAGISFPCVMSCRPGSTWEGTTAWTWESDLGAEAGFDAEERRPLERRLAALLMERIEDQAIIEDMAWECERIRRYRASVKAGESGAEGPGADEAMDAESGEGPR